LCLNLLDTHIWKWGANERGWNDEEFAGNYNVKAKGTNERGIFSDVFQLFFEKG
jgi:hypothetical protein